MISCYIKFNNILRIKVIRGGQGIHFYHGWSYCWNRGNSWTVSPHTFFPSSGQQSRSSCWSVYLVWWPSPVKYTTRKEGNVLFNDALNTVIWCQTYGWTTQHGFIKLNDRRLVIVIQYRCFFVCFKFMIHLTHFYKKIYCS